MESQHEICILQLVSAPKIFEIYLEFFKCTKTRWHSLEISDMFLEYLKYIEYV